MTPTTAHPLPPRAEPGRDLRKLCRAIPGVNLTGPSAPPGWRREVRIQHHLPGMELAGVQPLTPAGVVDGAQRRVVLTVRDARPLLLEYVGAAAVDPRDRKAFKIDERLYLAGSYLDANFLRSLPEEIPVVELDGIAPGVVAAEALETIGRFRTELEATVAAEVAASGDPVVVDGSVRHIPGLAGPAIGVVKNITATQWLTDESELQHLHPGWRSTVFTIPAQRRGEVTVHSCYVRLFNVRSLAWTDGLIRLESTHPDLLDAAAAWAYQSRQHPNSPDPRWACHLKPVYIAEQRVRNRMTFPVGD